MKGVVFPSSSPIDGRMNAQRLVDIPPDEGLVPIVVACDERYAMPLATLLSSITRNNKRHWPISIIVINDGFNPTLRDRVIDSIPRDSVNIRWVDIDLSFAESFARLDHTSEMTFARLAMLDIVDCETSHILYLDVDILVLGDLGPLCALKKEPFAIAAAPDMYIKVFPGSIFPYFNAGVLLVNIEESIKRGIFSKATQYLLDNPSTSYGDQDALNSACAGNWHCLEEKWNYQSHISAAISSIAASKCPSIVHFITKWKPWLPSSASKNSNLYESYRNDTQFSRTRRQKVFATIASILYRVYYKFLNIRRSISNKID